MKLTSKARRVFPIALVVLALLLPTAVAAAQPSAARAASAENLVTHIVLTPRTPNILRLNQSVTINFNYTTSVAGGVRIFARPMSGGALTPHYAASAAVLSPVGTGTGSQDFTITAGNPTVDGIRFQMWNDSQTTLLYEIIVPVSYQFTNATKNVVSQLGLSATPNILKPGQRVSVSFKYKVTNPGGVRIFARPLSGSALTPNYAAHPSPLYRVGSGTGRGWFTVTRGSRTVTQVRLQIWNAGQTRLLFQRKVPVSYKYRHPANIVNSIKLAPVTPNILAFGENVTLSASYTTNQVGGVRIFARPFSGGVLLSNYAAHPSPNYPIGSGAFSGWFTIVSGVTTVDEIRIQMWDDAQTKLLFEAKIPVFYRFE